MGLQKFVFTVLGLCFQFKYKYLVSTSQYEYMKIECIAIIAFNVYFLHLLFFSGHTNGEEPFEKK
jgi:hypothetical protein